MAIMTLLLLSCNLLRFLAPVSGFKPLTRRLPRSHRHDHRLAISPIGGSFQAHQHFSTSSSTSLPMSDATAQRTLAEGSHTAEMEVKKSRFLGHAKHVENWNEAQAYIDEVKALHPKARHWCYAACFGVNPVSARCSDDGEPTGTAGQPILNAINGEELSDVVCVVVRYSGGIKLGSGGLIRTYGASARQVLREAPVDILIPKSTFRVKVADAGHIGSIYDCVSKVSGGVTSGEEYGADGGLAVTITCDLEELDRLQKGLRDSTRGSIEFLDDE